MYYFKDINKLLISFASKYKGLYSHFNLVTLLLKKAFSKKKFPPPHNIPSP